MTDPLAGEGASQVVDAGFGDGVGGVRLWGVDDVAGHGGCEDHGRGGEGPRNDISAVGMLV